MLLPPWTNRALSPPALLGLAVAMLVLSSPGCAQGPPIPAGGVMAAEGGQVQVTAAPPGEQPAAAARVFQSAQRGDVIQAVVERGEVEPAHLAELVCRVRGRGPNKPAATIKWVIDDGTLVQKGDRLLELDDSALQEELKGQETAVAEKQALLVQAEAALKVAEASGKNAADSGQAAVEAAEADLKKHRAAEPRDKRKLEIKVQQARQALEIVKLKAQTEEGKLAVQQAEGDVEIAEIELKGHPEGVLADRQKLEAQLRQAQSAVTVAKVRAASARDQAQARIQAARAALDAESVRLNELKEDLYRCRLTAPQDGLALYAVPEPARAGAASPIVAVGEPVREGQRLLRVADLRQLQVRVRVHESQVARLRPAKDGDDRSRGQPARVRIDAFPDRTIAGHLRSVATVPTMQDWLASDVKVYPAVVALDEAPAGLKPGMSAEVTFVLDERKGVLRVPVQAVVAEAKERFCYVKGGDGVEKRKLATGLSDQRYVEVKEGLREGEEVLVNPPAERSGKDGRGPGAGPKQSRGPGNTDLIVRSVKPPADAANARRAFVLAYGLTVQDHEGFQTIGAVTRVVPLRIFPQEARRLEHVSRSRLVATLAEYAEVYPLDLATGRFLSAEDDLRSDNVAVLGSAAAQELFPLDDPLGQTVLLGRHLYSVVGVVGERPPQGGAGAEDFNHDVYIPLQTCRARFGERVALRSGGARTVEAVQLSQLIVSVRSPEQVAPTAALITSQLRQAHAQKDWDLQVPGERPEG